MPKRFTNSTRHSIKDFHVPACSERDLQELTGEHFYENEALQNDPMNLWMLVNVGGFFRLVNLQTGNRHDDKCACQSIAGMNMEPQEGVTLLNLKYNGPGYRRDETHAVRTH